MTKYYGWVAGVVMLSAGTALATPISGTSLQDSITALGGIVDVQTEQAAPDQKWRVGATGGAIANIQFELSAYANANSFGIYDIYNPASRLTIFSGGDGAGTTGVLFNLMGGNFCTATYTSGGFSASTCASFATREFGFFLNTPTGNTYYSQTLLNGDGVDHMVAFQGGPTRGTIGGNPWLANEYLLAWEDLYGGGDRDYQDFVVLVESVIGVPEPTGLATFGVGLLALGAIARRRAGSPPVMRNSI